MKKCKYCKLDNVSVLSDKEKIQYKGKSISILLEYSICGNCKYEFLTKNQILSNDSRLRDAKKTIEGLLTSKEIKQAREKLKLTQEQAAMVFGGGKNAFSKYERAEVSQSKAMDKLIRTCLHHPNAFKDLLIEAGISK